MNDPYDLKRFLDAQQHVFASVLTELKVGEKRGHWMWFIFPQLKGLGHSAMSTKFGISSLEEASAYLRHPLLGPRLLECTELVNATERRTIEDIFGPIDALKFRSSMTLFANAEPRNPIFTDALTKYFAGEPDPLTMARLRR